MKIGFYTAGPPFNGNALEEGPLGGSETAFIEITRALAERGHEILVFNNCIEMGVYNNVHYYPFKSSLDVLANNNFDVFVVSRFFGFFNLPINASLKVLWNHDTLDSPKDLRALHDEIDIFLVLSEFHRDNFLIRIPLLDDRLVLTKNGLNFNLLESASKNIKKNPFKLIYASRPERGLKLLLETIWPRLHKARPNLELYLCGYSLEKNGLAKDLLGLYDTIDTLTAETPGVYNLGSLGKIDYYRHLKEASIMLYPCIFPEVSCLAVLEAQALGTAVVTSNRFALKESVKIEEFKITGHPGSNEYVQSFIERTLDLIDNPQKTTLLVEKAKSIIEDQYHWSQVAKQWERIFRLNIAAKTKAL